MIVSDAPSCGITYDHHYDDSKGINYNRNMFLLHATDDVPCSFLMI
jgi:hypothetical protein